MAGEYGEWGQDIRKGFDAFLAGNHDTALVYYEIAAELGYEVAMVRGARSDSFPPFSSLPQNL